MNVKDENHGPGVNIENEFVQIGRAQTRDVRMGSKPS